MYKLTYRISNSAPLVLTSRQGDPNMVTTEGVISGSKVLGLLAQRYIVRQSTPDNGEAHRDAVFHNCFMKGALTIGPAFPVLPDSKGEEQPHLPVPFSVRRKKHGEEIYDFLFHKYDSALRTKPVDGFCLLESDCFEPADVQRGINFHHARDRETGTTDGEKIFSYESLEAGQRFEGTIYGSRDDLQTLLDRCGQEWTGAVGRSKNSQYGTIQMRFLEKSPQVCQNPALLTTAAEPGAKISLTLLSDTIVYNDCGYPSTTRQDLANHLSARLNTGVTLVKARAKQAEVETYLGVWGLKTPSEGCFMAGSSFLLELPDGCSSDALAELEWAGIGERCGEGFGRCRIAWQTEGKLQVPDAAERTPEQPQGDLPDGTRHILTTLAIETLKKDAVLAALEEQSRFRHLPSNSLLGRLENAVGHSGAPQAFGAFLAQLRNTARRQLEHCHNTQRTLLEFLTTERICAQSLIALNRSGLSELIQEFGLSFDTYERLDDELYILYLSTFFANLRKRNAPDQKEG